ncbi:Hypothetical predicted protein [Paramuricea clavata]|uniref:Uncharacterized protein n=1 Tax=Paramuricea clavata TaxID=317549 RepID=A0A7D9J558_PARCT|nr:Hypothetical predicted protein [Paramuricea clavata]
MYKHKKTHSCLKQLALKQLAKTQKPSIKIAELTDDHGNMYTEPQEISEIMNNFFINILKQVGDNTTQAGEFLHEQVIAEFVSSKISDDQAQFSIPEITSKDVQEIIDKLSNNKATGSDGISVKLLKLIAPVFCEPLTKLLNYSIATNTFPSAWKMARVTPPFIKMENVIRVITTDQYQYYPYCRRFSKNTWPNP